MVRGTVVTDVIKSWKAMANIEADPVVAVAVDEGLAELEKGARRRLVQSMTETFPFTSAITDKTSNEHSFNKYNF